MTTAISQIIMLAALVAIVSYNVTKQGIFEWFRKIVCDRFRGTPCEKVTELIQCHYCFSHWVAFVALWLAGWPCLKVSGRWIDYPITWAILVVLSQPIMIMLDWSIDGMDSFFKIFGEKKNLEAEEEENPEAEEVELHAENTRGIAS